MRKNYSCKAIEDFIEKYCEECLFSGDSVIGLGDQVWTKKQGGYFIVHEYFINSWASGHEVRQVSKLSKRIQKMIEDPELNLLLQD